GKEALARIEAGVIELKQQQQATAGIGLTQVATPEPEVSGVDVSQRVDLPSCYVTLYDKPTGNALGIYLLSVELSHYRGMAPQEVPGQPAAVELRPARHYKAYTLHLHDFKFDRYIGTETAKNYSSDVRLEDPALGQDRDVTIRMNEPLRHRGDAIFQSSFTPDEKATILQVVSNPGWQIPYISCVLVMAGMGLHFCIKLVQFLARSLTTAKPAPVANKPAPTGVDLTARGLSPFARYGVPAVGAVLALVVLVGAAWPRKPAKDRLDLQKIATLPVVDGGRVKPLDTVARVDLRLITHAEEFPDENGKKRSAIQWFLDVATSTPDRADGPAALPIFRIENDDVRSLLKLPRREGLRYSIAEMKGQFASFDAEAKKAAEVPDKDRTLFQSKLLELRKHVEIYLRVAFGDTPLLFPPEGEKGWRKVAEAEQEGRRSEMESLERAMPRIRERLTAAGIPPGLKDLTEEQRAVADYVHRRQTGRVRDRGERVSQARDRTCAGRRREAGRVGDVPQPDRPVLLVYAAVRGGRGGEPGRVRAVAPRPEGEPDPPPRGVLVAGRHVRGAHADAPRPHVPDGPAAGVRDEPVFVGSRHRLDGAPPVPHPGSGGAHRVR
nr:cytochrome c biogenesis protein ResB [Fimbriiglobus sp.]